MKKTFQLLDKILNIYLPGIFFFIMFSTFIFQILSRYIFGSPVTWAYEVTVIAYLWVAVLGANYAYNVNEHVSFSIVYDLFPPKVKKIMFIIGKVLIIVTFTMFFLPSYELVKFSFIRSSSVLRIPFGIIYLPILVFILNVLVKTSYMLYEELILGKNLSGAKSKEEKLKEEEEETWI